MLPPIGQNWNSIWSSPLIKSDLMEQFPRTSSGYRNCNWIVTAVITGASTISFWYLWHNYKTGLWVWDAEEMRFWERRIRNQCQPPKQDTGREKWANCPGGVRDQPQQAGSLPYTAHMCGRNHVRTALTPRGTGQLPWTQVYLPCSLSLLNQLDPKPPVLVSLRRTPGYLNLFWSQFPAGVFGKALQWCFGFKF